MRWKNVRYGKYKSFHFGICANKCTAYAWSQRDSTCMERGRWTSSNHIHLKHAYTQHTNENRMHCMGRVKVLNADRCTQLLTSNRSVSALSSHSKMDERKKKCSQNYTRHSTWAVVPYSQYVVTGYAVGTAIVIGSAIVWVANDWTSVVSQHLQMKRITQTKT